MLPSGLLVPSGQGGPTNAHSHEVANVGARRWFWAVAAVTLLVAGCGKKKDQWRESPLHDAAWRGDVQQAQVLIAHGANLNARDERGRTPLHLAVGGGYADIVSLLLASGAKVNACDNDGDTPLHSAALHGHKALVELLLSHGADPSAKNSRGRTPLDEGTRRGHTDVVQQLDTRLSKNEQNIDPQTNP